MAKRMSQSKPGAYSAPPNTVVKTDRRAFLVGALVWSSFAAQGAQRRNLRYVEALPFDLFGRYALAVLGEALGRLPQSYRLQAVPNFEVTQGRIELEVERPGGPLDIMSSMTSREREQRLLPIRVPLDRGLLGWRVAVIRRADLPKWREPMTLERLKSLRAGQGLHWPDVDILRSNGLEVSTAASTGNLFEMLRKGRIDYFPRSVLEVIDELKAEASKRLNDFALSRGYDSIESLASYTSSTDPDYAAESARGIYLRDRWWRLLTVMMNEVLAGTRPIPANFDVLAVDLPELTWDTPDRPAA